MTRDERTVITIQPANSADGTYDVHASMPYPFHVDAATGDVGRQEFWKGAPFRVLGFQKDAAVQKVDLWWEQAASDPDQIVGMFAVMLDTSEEEPHMYNLTYPISSVTCTKVDAE